MTRIHLFLTEKKNHWHFIHTAVNGNWAEWGEWQPCDCETSTQGRTRQCNNPAPTFGGQDCEGAGDEQQECVPEGCTGINFSAFYFFIKEMIKVKIDNRINETLHLLHVTLMLF